MQRKEGTGCNHYGAISNTLLSKCDFKCTYTYLLKVFTPTGAPAGGCKMNTRTVPLLYVSYWCKVRLLTTLKSQMNNKANNISVLEKKILAPINTDMLLSKRSIIMQYLTLCYWSVILITSVPENIYPHRASGGEWEINTGVNKFTPYFIWYCSPISITGVTCKVRCLSMLKSAMIIMTKRYWVAWHLCI